MRILVLSNLYPPFFLGGYELLCAQVVDELRRLGHEVFVLTSDHGVTGAPPESDEGLVQRDLKLYVPFNQPPGFLYSTRRRVGRDNYRVTMDAIRRLRPDLCFVWSLLRLTVGPARAAEDSGLPVAYTFNDENIMSYRFPLSRSPRYLSACLIFNLFLRETTLHGLALRHTTCISQRLKSNLLKRGAPIDNADVIYQGIPLDRFPLKPSPGRMGAPVRVLYAGQLHAYKGVHTLVEGAHLAAARGINMSVSVVGDGPDAYVRDLREKAGQGAAAITFLGKRPQAELPALYREHDLFVFPSIWEEPFGLTHLEAMASGTPVISTADGGHGEFLRHESNALVFPKENAPALADSIARLVAHPELAVRLAEQGRRTVETGFTMAGYVGRLSAFLKNVSRGHDEEAAGRDAHGGHLPDLAIGEC